MIYLHGAENRKKVAKTLTMSRGFQKDTATPEAASENFKGRKDEKINNLFSL